MRGRTEMERVDIERIQDDACDTTEMTILVTGSSGHLGEAIARTLTDRGAPFRGIDLKPGAFTHRVGSVCDPVFVCDAMRGVHVVMHTATLHKPHVETHTEQDFIDTNVTGTNQLLEAARIENVNAFVMTSTTSVFGDAMKPGPGEPAVWVTEGVTPVPKNIYGITKYAAEELCRLYNRRYGLNALVLRTSRFFPEEDDARERRDGWSQDNVKANEFLFRRVEIADCVEAHLLGAERAHEIGFGRYIISATSPFMAADLKALRTSANEVAMARAPKMRNIYDELGWRMFEDIDRVYVNEAARRDLGWRPAFDFDAILSRLAAGQDMRSELAIAVGKKGYHDQIFTDGPYPTHEHE